MFPRAILPRMMAACVITVTVLGATLAAQETGGRIAGSVADFTGAPVPGASIALDGPAKRDVRAGEDGRFLVTFSPTARTPLRQRWKASRRAAARSRSSTATLLWSR